MSFYPYKWFGLLCIKTAVRGAYFNVMLNAGGLNDKAYANEMKEKAKALLLKNHQEIDAALQMVEDAIAF